MLLTGADDARIQRARGRRRDEDLTGRRLALARAYERRRRAGDDQTAVRRTGGREQQRARCHADAAGQRRAPEAGRGTAKRPQRALQVKRGGGGAQLVPLVAEGDDQRVAAEADDVPAESLRGAGEAVHDPVDERDERLCPLAAVLGQPLRQRREARDVGEEDRAVDLRQVRAAFGDQLTQDRRDIGRQRPRREVIGGRHRDVS